MSYSRKRTLLMYLLIPFFAAAAIVCSDKKNNNIDSSASITLRWVKGHDRETNTKVEKGLKWCLLFMGARLESGSFKRSVSWLDKDKLLVDFTHIGFSSEGFEALKKLLVHMKLSGEYTEKGGIDIGRFIMLTLNSPYHYYAITNAPKTMKGYKNPLLFDSVKTAMPESNVAHGHRIIEVPKPENTDILKSGFASLEGTGSVIDGSFMQTEYEVFDIMPNGMFRFMLYDESGRLKPAADSILSKAGKPSKCIWCHETNFQFASVFTTPVKGYHSPSGFDKIVNMQSELLASYRGKLNMDIDYSDDLEHFLMEIIYISFMEPSALRLALEWNITETQVKERLMGLPVHINNEFPFLGEVYHRKDVDKLSPYNIIQVPESALEPSIYEPDLIK